MYTLSWTKETELLIFLLFVGISKTLEVEVINESVVHVDANVKISSDGPEISSITLIDYSVADKPKPKIPQWPREFHIEPQKIHILPESRVSIKVRYYESSFLLIYKLALINNDTFR